MSRRLYLVTIEVQGLVLAESEDEAMSLADRILDTEDERSIKVDEVEPSRRAVPIEWTDDCILYTPNDDEYLTVLEAIAIAEGGA